jgi:hypothetical protein
METNPELILAGDLDKDFDWVYVEKIPLMGRSWIRLFPEYNSLPFLIAPLFHPWVVRRMVRVLESLDF